MLEKNFYTIKELAEKLDSTESQIRAWRDQFDVWIPFTGRGDKKWYPKIAAEMLQMIADGLNAGKNVSEIESMLETTYNFHTADASDNSKDTVLPSMDMLTALRQALDNISLYQHRIATAQERCAAAEERKAAALEKEAEVRQLMTTAIQELTATIRQNGSPEFTPVRIMPDDPTSVPADTSQSKASDDLSDLIDALPITDDSGDIQIEKADQPQPDDLDNLMDLIDGATPNQPNSSEPRAENAQQTQPDDLDNLMDLIDGATPNQPNSSEPRAENAQQTQPDDLDNLMDLIDGATPTQTDSSEPRAENAQQTQPDDLDNLMDLIDGATPTQTDSSGPRTENAKQMQPDDLDNLMDLIDDTPPTQPNSSESRTENAKQTQPEDIDNLADLIEAASEGATADTREPSTETDDLSALIKSVPEKPTAAASKPPARKTKEIPADYKSKIIAVIIAMKEKQKLSIDDTVNRLNDKGYRPISGKKTWDRQAIEQIYQHIDMVRDSRKQVAL